MHQYLQAYRFSVVENDKLSNIQSKKVFVMINSGRTMLAVYSSLYVMMGLLMFIICPMIRLPKRDVV